jgi:integrase
MAAIIERISNTGEKSFQVKVRLKGFPVQTATFKRITDAKKWAQNTESAIREGRHFKTTEAKKHTFGDMVDRYIESVLPNKPKSEEKQSAQLRWWKEELGAYTLADVTPAMIGECRDKLLQGVTYRGTKRSNATVVRYLAALSHAFSIAANEWGWIENSPMRKVRKPTEPKGRVRFLSDEERPRLLEKCKESSNPYLYPIVVLALSTGMRHGEIVGLTWDVVDFQRNLLFLLETKNGERRAAPLTGLAHRLLKTVHDNKKGDTPLVFPGTGENAANIRLAWEEAMDKAKLENFRFHDLRHSAASYLAMNGATLAELAEILGHKTLAMVKRYSHLSEQHTSRVVASMNEKIFGGGVD